MLWLIKAFFGWEEKTIGCPTQTPSQFPRPTCFLSEAENLSTKHPPPPHAYIEVACFGPQNQNQRDDVTFDYIGSWSVIRE